MLMDRYIAKLLLSAIDPRYARVCGFSVNHTLLWSTAHRYALPQDDDHPHVQDPQPAPLVLNLKDDNHVPGQMAPARRASSGGPADKSKPPFERRSSGRRLSQMMSKISIQARTLNTRPSAPDLTQPALRVTLPLSLRSRNRGQVGTATHGPL